MSSLYPPPKSMAEAFKWMYRENDLGILDDEKFTRELIRDYGAPMSRMVTIQRQRWESRQPRRRKMSALHQAYARRR